MTGKPRSEAIRAFIIATVEDHPREVARRAAEQFGISRQAVNRHLAILVEDGILEAKGKTREREYALVTDRFEVVLPLAENRDEDLVWREHVQRRLMGVPENVRRICHYGFTEMFNNVIDHSEGTQAVATVAVSARRVALGIDDDGVGIFRKLRERFGFEDFRRVVLELAKGKLTTDPQRHSGQGIFFTSRMFDRFEIRANDHMHAVVYDGTLADRRWMIELPEAETGTQVRMEVNRDVERTPKDVFDAYTDLTSGDYAFSRTVVPMALAQYGTDQLVSRSQAKRVLARFEDFKEVVLDFRGVESIGQAFSDEIFRVFRNAHPDVEVTVNNANDEIRRMIYRAVASASAPAPGD